MKLVHRAGNCKNGPCHNVHDVAEFPTLAAVQGTTMTDSEALAQLVGMPSHESVVLIPKDILLEYARVIAQESS